MQTVRAGWFESPFYTTDANGRRSGYAYEYLQKIASYTGWNYEYVTGTWPELMDMLARGEIDLMSDVSFTEERAENLLFSSLPMGAEEYYLYVEPGVTEYPSGNYGYFNGKTVGVNRGSIQKDYLDKWLKANQIRAEIVELSGTAEDAFTMLKQRELDGYVALDAYGTTGSAVPAIWMGASDFFFAVSKDRPDVLQELDAAMIRIQDENRFYSQQLFQKYFSTFGDNIHLTDAESEWLEQHGAIRIGYQDDYLAFCAKDPKTGQPTGVLRDYLAIAADCLANAHLDFETAAYPTADDAMSALKSGEIDCMFPSNLSVYDGETLGVRMTPPIIRAEAYALIRKSDRQVFSEKERVTIAVEPTDINYHAVVQDLFPDWLMVDFPDTMACLRAVSSGKADRYLSNNYQYNSLRRECDHFGLTLLATGKEADFTIAVNSGSQELYSILARTTAFVSEASMNAALTYYTAEGTKVRLGDLILDNIQFNRSVHKA